MELQHESSNAGSAGTDISGAHIPGGPPRYGLLAFLARPQLPMSYEPNPMTRAQSHHGVHAIVNVRAILGSVDKPSVWSFRLAGRRLETSAHQDMEDAMTCSTSGLPLFNRDGFPRLYPGHVPAWMDRRMAPGVAESTTVWVLGRLTCFKALQFSRGFDSGI